MAKATTLNIRIDKDLKVQAEELFNDLGLTMSAAFNIFIRQSLREGRIPFELTLSSTRPYKLSGTKDSTIERNDDFDN